MHISSASPVLPRVWADGVFSVFGFGARLPDNTVSHCFPATFADPRVVGVDGTSLSTCLI